MQAIVNIGLNTNAGGELDSLDAIQALAQAGFFIYGTQVLESDTEPTLVATVGFDGPWHAAQAAAAQLSAQLQQDCIAIYQPASLPGLNGRGALCGPKADAWGPFNPEYFITADGRRLAGV